MATEPSETSTNAPGFQLASLVPSFDPSKDNMILYSQKVELVLAAWPKDRITELVTRLILNTHGSAFQKLQIHQAELVNGDPKSVKKIVELLGGQWGRIALEHQYHDAEQALYNLQQQSDESNDSYLARADVAWSKLLARKLSLEELQSYVILRGSLLTPDEKKKIALDADQSLEGKLSVRKVSESIRLLGATFFGEMTGLKKNIRTKTYDAQTLMATGECEGSPDLDDGHGAVLHTHADEDDEIEENIFQLAQDGDKDAILVTEYENAISEIVQEDPELAATFNLYEDARRRLNERFKNRGFWPVKGAGKNQKGGKKGKGGGKRKTLQDRILNSRCRICLKVGHWKAECPLRFQGQGSSSASTSQTTVGSTPAAMTAVTIAENPTSIGLPMEFMNLTDIPEKPIDAASTNFEHILCFGVSEENTDGYHSWSTLGNQGSRVNVDSVIDSSRAFLTNDRTERSLVQAIRLIAQKKCRPVSFSREINPNREPQVVLPCSAEHETCYFASHGSFGIVDSGASKTVIGSNLLAEMIRNLSSSVREKVYRCKSSMVFRFGNQGTLKSECAMVIPLGPFQLKVAVVPGNTPFLLSNTLMRALSFH